MAANDKPQAIAPLPFGIPQLDRLLGYKDLDPTDLAVCLRAATSLAIVGQDGTGKSVFALHLAAYYHALRMYFRQQQNAYADEVRAMPLVVYVSSDLGYSAAHSVWQNFYLDYPWHRYVPFIPAKELKFRRSLLTVQDGQGNLTAYRTDLVHCAPSHTEQVRLSLVDFIHQARTNGENAAAESKVAFLDLAANTTGDDWLFLSRLLASAPRLPHAPPNLLILDSVAGFESLVGERNSFGEEMSRRARIAQLLRSAEPNWHVVFVVEEPDTGTHHPEEYVTDTVIHLRHFRQGENVRRVLEIEKSRARSFGTGQHPFEIRDGAGTSTGSWENPDDPCAVLHDTIQTELARAAAYTKFEGEGTLARQRWNAYLQVFQSIQYHSKDFATRTKLIQPEKTHERPVVPFGIPYLDDMLGSSQERYGLPEGSVTSLIGDEGTRKANLAEQFLIEAFQYFPQILELAITIATRWRHGGDLNTYIRKDGSSILDGIAPRLPDSLKKCLTDRLDHWIPGSHASLRELAKNTRWRLAKSSQSSNSAVDRSDGTENKTSLPLMTRWDVVRYYQEDEQDQPEQQHNFIVALSILRMSCGLLTPVVFISTHDTSAEQLSKRILDSHAATLLSILKKCGIEENSATAIDEDRRVALMRLMERFILVRRLELIDSTAAQLWHLIHRCAIHALYLIGHDDKEVEQSIEPVEHSGLIRMVVSDLRSIRDVLPSVDTDPFLPTLVFRLRRLGVTSLLVDSDNGRPDLQPGSAMSGALRSLVDHRIYTWKVQFFSEQRVAISVIPPLTEGTAGDIRELTHAHDAVGEAKYRGEMVVDPHFELYTGIEEGRPSAVPLQVVLYAETPAFEEYIEVETALFRRLFASAPGGDCPVIQVQKTGDYDGLRDYCRLPIDTRLPFTFVFMVDGYWALGRNGSLRNLFEDLVAAGAHNTRADEYADVFQLFRKTQYKKNKTGGKSRRYDFFSQIGEQKEGDLPEYLYKARIPDPDKHIDRVPFTWDFGFLVCDKTQWDAAREVELSLLKADGKAWKVADVWANLPKAQLSKEKEAEQDPHIRLKGEKLAEIRSWRAFFDACIKVGTVEERRTGLRSTPFDIAMATPEEFSCFLFEVWFSEIVKDAHAMHKLSSVLTSKDSDLANKAEKWASDALNMVLAFSRAEYREPDSGISNKLSSFGEVSVQELLRPSEYGSTIEIAFIKVKEVIENNTASSGVPRVSDEQIAYCIASIQTMLPGYTLQLYKAWLLLVEVLDVSQYFDEKRPFRLRIDHHPSRNTIAARHWYKTACVSLKSARADSGERLAEYRPLRLPGYFTVRGDWFLAVAKGSRSSRLADRALDMLTSRRANRTRLHLGLGLPTRDVNHEKAAERIRTNPDSVATDQQK